jgi:curved DNA-binding protein CbpA
MSEEEAAEIIGDDSPWSILGIAPGSPFDVIKKAWRKLAMKYHPDRHPKDKQKWAEKNFIRCQAAYVSLGGR